MKQKTKPSDRTRSERRRVAKLRQMTRRQQRWRDACLVIESSFLILSNEEDKFILNKFKSAVKDVDRYLNQRQTDEQIVLKAVTRGAWLISEISEETGFSTVYVRENLRSLCEQDKVARFVNLYKAVG